MIPVARGSRSYRVETASELGLRCMLRGDTASRQAQAELLGEMTTVLARLCSLQIITPGSVKIAVRDKIYTDNGQFEVFDQAAEGAAQKAADELEDLVFQFRRDHPRSEFELRFNQWAEKLIPTYE